MRCALCACVMVWAASVEAAECSACRLPAPKGALTCWGCGSHLPGAPLPGDIVRLDFAPARIYVLESAPASGPAAVSPEVALDTIEQWIKENPRNYDGALARLQELLGTARGTDLEMVIEARVRQVKADKAKALAPKTAQQRMAEAAKTYTEVADQVRREPDRVINNIKLLEGLLDVCKDTPYENLVKQQLQKERAKLSR